MAKKSRKSSSSTRTTSSKKTTAPAKKEAEKIVVEEEVTMTPDGPIEAEAKTEVTSPPKPDTIEIVYTGVAERARRLGSSTGIEYVFEKDENGDPAPTSVRAEDAEALLNEKGSGCIRRLPETMFLMYESWQTLQ